MTRGTRVPAQIQLVELQEVRVDPGVVSLFVHRPFPESAADRGNRVHKLRVSTVSNSDAASNGTPGDTDIQLPQLPVTTSASVHRTVTTQSSEYLMYGGGMRRGERSVTSCYRCN